MSFYSIFKTFLSEFQFFHNIKTIIKIFEHNSCGGMIFANKMHKNEVKTFKLSTNFTILNAFKNSIAFRGHLEVRDEPMVFEREAFDIFSTKKDRNSHSTSSNF